MLRLPIDVEKSFHYSRARVRTFDALEHGPLYPTALARAARIDLRTLRGVMDGDPPRYHPERALVTLGLVERVDHPNGEYYQLTAAGRRVAASRRGPRMAGTIVPAVEAELAPAGPEE